MTLTHWGDQAGLGWEREIERAQEGIARERGARAGRKVGVVARSVRLDGTPGLSRFGAETVDLVPFINTSDNLHEEDMPTFQRPSRIVLADLLGGRRVAAVDDTSFHVTPDIVAVEESNTPHTNTK